MTLHSSWIEHQREVTDFIVFISNVGGVYEVILMIMFFMCGGFLEFYTKIKWVSSLFQFQSETS